jgi:mRNA interferase MazF
MRSRIVLVPFPFDDLSGTKIRSALCLTYPSGAYGHIVAAFISSVVPTPLLATDLVLDPADPDVARTGLRVRSVICT